VATEQVTLSIIASPLASSKLKTQLLALVKAGESNVIVFDLI
jgi:hypothetical protein